MTMRTWCRIATSAASFALAASFSATPAMADSNGLKARAQLSCIYLPAALSGIETVKQAATVVKGALGAWLSDFLQGPENGTIAKLPQSGNPEFNARLREFARKAVPVKSADSRD